MRVFIADDSIIFRKLLSDIMSEIPGIEIVGTANNGKIAFDKIKQLKPDFVTLDIEMPEMSGIDVLNGLKKEGLSTNVVVVSALTVKGGELTMKALELGALDFITKPESGDVESNKNAIKKTLTILVKAIADKIEIKQILGAKLLSQASTIAPSLKKTTKNEKVEMVLIGVSTGGPQALLKMLPLLPTTINVPVFIVQHMPPLFTQSLAESLAAKCSLKVKEAVDSEVALPNCVYIAPGGKQMRVNAGPNNSKIIQITDDPPENNCKPSVDYLFRSVSNNFPKRSCAVIMTGMGSDGTLGLRLLKRQGAFVIAQDEASSVVYGMPGEAIKAGVVDIVVPLEKIASSIVSALGEYGDY